VPTEKKPPKPKAFQKKLPPRAPKAIPRPPLPKGLQKSQSAKSKRSAAPKPISGKLAIHRPAATKRSLKSVVLDALDDMKALEVKVLDVRGLTDIADYMVIASGTSDRHVRSVAQRVVEKTKEAGFRPHGLEGLTDGDWVLIDLHEYIVHVMLPRVREFYGLEKLWDMTAKRAVRA
jgi:ribosome-associated protein